MVAPSPVTDLSGRVVVITGGNGGIGLGIAKGCVLAGADVMIWGRNTDKLAAAERELISLAKGRVLAQHIDVSSEEQVDSGMTDVIGSLGRLDAVVANAGVSAQPIPFIEQTTEQWHALQAVNADGLFFTLRAAARSLIQQGEGGALVGVSSTSAIHGAPMAQSYAASKAGVLAIMRGLAVELARHNIRCNTIVPGWTETEMTEPGRRNAKFLAATTSRTPIRRWGVPDDFAAIGAYLVDPTLMYHTGDEIVLDGGYTRF